MTISELKNIQNQEVGQKLTRAWSVIENGDYGSGETINHIPENTMTIEGFFDHLIGWYTLSDLNYNTVEDISKNGFNPEEYTQVFTLLLNCYDLTNTKTSDDLLHFLKSNGR
jgi:hypothetical protein